MNEDQTVTITLGQMAAANHWPESLTAIAQACAARLPDPVVVHVDAGSVTLLAKTLAHRHNGVLAAVIATGV